MDQRSLAPVWRRLGYVRQLCATTICCSTYTVSYHALLFKLLLKDMHHNYMRTGFEVRACTASSPSSSRKKENSFHKLVRTFMRKIFVVQCHPWNIFRSNYCQTTVCHVLRAHWMIHQAIQKCKGMQQAIRWNRWGWL